MWRTGRSGGQYKYNPSEDEGNHRLGNAPVSRVFGQAIEPKYCIQITFGIRHENLEESSTNITVLRVKDGRNDGLWS
jgi:hypothetical protein